MMLVMGSRRPLGILLRSPGRMHEHSCAERGTAAEQSATAHTTAIWHVGRFGCGPGPDEPTLKLAPSRGPNLVILKNNQFSIDCGANQHVPLFPRPNLPSAPSQKKRTPPQSRAARLLRVQTSCACSACHFPTCSRTQEWRRIRGLESDRNWHQGTPRVLADALDAVTHKGRIMSVAFVCGGGQKWPCASNDGSSN